MDYRFYRDQEGNEIGRSLLDDTATAIKAVAVFSLMVAVLLAAWLFA